MVDLPLPEGPRTATNSPGAIWIETSCKISLDTCLVTMVSDTRSRATVPTPWEGVPSTSVAPDDAGRASIQAFANANTTLVILMPDPCVKGVRTVTHLPFGPYRS